MSGSDPFPLSDEARLELELLASEAESKGLPEGAGSKRGFRVLVVDDDAEMRAYVRRCLLSEDEVGEVIEVQDGAEALAYVRQAGADLVVSDVIMPIMDGFELCRALREDPRFAELPVLLVTGELSSRDAREGARQAGASDILTKPFNAQKLCARSLRLLRSRGPP